jgi:hypothetical protein
MLKRALISLVLIVVLLVGTVLPVWASPPVLPDASDTGFLVSLGRISPMGVCEDPGAGGCSG